MLRYFTAGETHGKCLCQCEGGNLIICTNMICFPESDDLEKRKKIIDLITSLIQAERKRLNWNEYFDHPYFMS